MKRLKKILLGLLFPHPLLTALLCPAALALLIYSAVACVPTDAISIIAYTLSFYGLLLLVLRMPRILRFIQRFRHENSFLVRFSSDVQFRMNLTLLGAFIFNTVYAAFQLGLGLWHHSVWFYAMSGYYLLLALMRLLLMRHTRSHVPGALQEPEWRKYRLCGILLLLMTFALAIFIIYFILKIRTVRHHEITTIAMAAYSFTALTLAIVNAVRYRRYESPAYSAAKAISLVSAIVSMLTLENAMLTAFGSDSSEAFRRIILGASGAAAILAVQGISIYMIFNAGRRIKAIHRS